ncbi:hypothetical protein [Pedobacter soli]|uniref:hypothetical protein n=1 Tax=Pedobacter soli TaxID=390242 RepID=UPI000B8866FA|nr:hypothetical protein [Pedobacter soli]
MINLTLNPDVTLCCMAALSVVMFDICNRQRSLPLPIIANETSEQKEVREEIRHILEQQFSK